MKTFYSKIIFVGIILLIFFSCHQAEENAAEASKRSIQILDFGSDPYVFFHEGYYYYTQGSENKVVIWKTAQLEDLRNATQKEVWIPQDKSNAFHLWGPELHRINGKWYIYYAADDGNMDNHQIYVIENSHTDPLIGDFTFKNRIQTDSANNWAIHANVFQRNKDWYMVWSGWKERRIEEETQHIYIAKMKNPWTLSSERVLISTPEYEWERQWINPDGTRTSYPIYVNEAPQSFYSPNKDKIFISYSASGNWTPFYNVGLLYADIKSDLLDPSSWKKVTEPVFHSNPKDNVFGTGNLMILPDDQKNRHRFIYHARTKPNDETGGVNSRSPRVQEMKWTEDGFPVFGMARHFETEK